MTGSAAPAGQGTKARAEGALLGLSFGFPAAFALWVFRVDFANRICHYGGAENASLANIACLKAGAEWLELAVLATIAGAVLGTILLRSEWSRRGARVISISLSPLYLLAIRTSWGRWDLWSEAPQVSPPPVQSMPVIASVVPVLLAGSACLLVYRFTSRGAENPAMIGKKGRTAEPPRPAGPDPGAAGRDAASIALAQFCLACLAIEVSVQLPYYLGAASAFFQALGDFKSLL
jgi:hypothetical protein